MISGWRAVVDEHMGQVERIHDGGIRHAETMRDDVNAVAGEAFFKLVQVDLVQVDQGQFDSPFPGHHGEGSVLRGKRRHGQIGIPVAARVPIRPKYVAMTPRIDVRATYPGLRHPIDNLDEVAAFDRRIRRDDACL